MIDLARSMGRWHTRKQEHTTTRQRTPTPGGREWDGDDVDTVAALFGSVAQPDQVVAAGAVISERIVRQARRAGVCRSAKTSELRALIFTAWLDGLGTGLHPVDVDDPEGAAAAG